MSEHDNNDSPETVEGPSTTLVYNRTESPRPDTLAILPMSETVLFPELVMPIVLDRKPAINAAQRAMRADQPVGLLLGDPDGNANDLPGSLHKIGTAANILRYVTGNDGQHHLVCQGISRFRVREFIEDDNGGLAAKVTWIDEPEAEGDKQVDARMTNLRNRALEAIQLMDRPSQELANAIQSIESASLLADATAGYLGLKPKEKQRILETIDIESRLELVQSFMDYRLEVMRLSNDINQQTQQRMSEHQRKAMLREQMRSIQRELGEDESVAEEAERLREALDKAHLPEEAAEQTERELKRLERMNESSAEYSMVRTYLELMAELPWDKLSKDAIDIAESREILDEDHYGLDKIKRRILEHLAVHKLNPDGKAPILCFVGPPGVGKTSLGRSIARAMNREFVRAALGGVHDESEIRGHRRTYVGAMPGSIISQIRKAGTRNPVFMLDEVDKLGASAHGDPASALLEVLDPSQNDSFNDHYLGTPFDLSKVMFIATANVLDTIPGPLRDRMEVIEVPGYTREEKKQIAKRYLIDRQLKQAGLTREQCDISDDALDALISGYTREAGLRNLEREIGAIARHAAVQVAEGKPGPGTIGPDDLHDIIGPRRVDDEVALRTGVAGVATGLAWTPAGGDILFVEASRAPGNGKLTITGQLGDVMRESAQAALSLVKARADALGIDQERLDKSDLHIHVPAGAIKKDGPSAGVALYTALVSLLTDRNVRADVAMTGEISLRGQVLPIGGVKEKTLAAHQAGIKTVMLPERNRKDEDDIPENVREALDIRYISDVEQAIEIALEDEPVAA
ncbi:endopeptidase La [Salinisphaera hydrothermalis]|uniref:Lon protease n=1 Tax=Salinisphaera hydrothermalis (strain C41B8) TaxID=1304275 RepID=A0A084IQR7_SALHC|nr:endopeptidase La [Salinisphaera hydrothermalis]KEZ79051.1 ATP-dependent protease La [Salinisphaera hydrothermalis C41B8]